MSAGLKLEQNSDLLDKYASLNICNIAVKQETKKSLKIIMSLQEFCKPQVALTNEQTLKSLVKTKVERYDPKFFYQDYEGKIDAGYFDPQFVRIRDVSDKILFSQTTVSDFSKQGRYDLPISTLADQLFAAFKEEGAIDIVDNEDGTFTSLDNRRLLIAKRIGLVDRTYGIWVKVHSFHYALNSHQERRFEATTWGMAVTQRIGNPRLKGYCHDPIIMDEGQQKRSTYLSNF
ncbi:MAG: hypothetical protein HWD61_05725 [Parachlamydiaceae bacterium]|nr:MAG: hypothetical protein HWD61_05725 [Parachlamydiaceae bacterium]